jgi:sugar phosphate isomerase/epimerase
MVRRQFLGAFAAAGLPSASAKPAAFDRSRLSVFTDEIGSLESAIAFAREYRLRYVEVRAYRPRPDAEWKEVRRQLDGAGLRVSFFNSALLKYTLPGTTAVKWEDFYENLYRAEGLTPEKLFERREADLDTALRAANILGAPAIRTFAFWRTAEPASLTARLTDLLGPMTEKASRAGIHLALENEFATNCGTTAETVAVLN